MVTVTLMGGTFEIFKGATHQCYGDHSIITRCEWTLSPSFHPHCVNDKSQRRPTRRKIFKGAARQCYGNRSVIIWCEQTLSPSFHPHCVHDKSQRRPTRRRKVFRRISKLFSIFKFWL